MTVPPLPAAPALLARALVAARRRALGQGALRPIETQEEVLEDRGVRFLVWRVSSLAAKDAVRATEGGAARAAANPFLPFDPALFVADVSETHVALLNKFPVLDHHLLLVTRAFVPQEALLDAQDHAALALALAAIDGLAFYNGGRAAGASQDHKHLQLVPLPLASESPSPPIAARLEGDAPALPFAHAFARLDPAVFARPPEAAEALRAAYGRLLAACGIGALAGRDGPRQSAPYNLLATRRWMLFVPRSAERFEGISINALGFAGSFFVRDRGELERLRRAGPMAALCAVARPGPAVRAG
jgi:ATP adenylyltransferase